MENNSRHLKIFLSRIVIPVIKMFTMEALDPNCSSCHETSSFKQINKSAFDHSRTKFPLIGKHKSVGCNNCHKSPTGYKMKFSLCTDCHTDFHKAQFVVNDQTQNCADCHSENGFRPSSFSIEKHNKTQISNYRGTFSYTLRKLPLSTE